MSALTRVSLLRNVLPLANRCMARNISTSKKKSDTSSVINPAVVENTVKPKSKNWISYGFSIESEAEDRYYLNMVFFGCVTILLVFGGFSLAYRPDGFGRDWAQREAYLELRRRERLGLPSVDPNYISLDKLSVPEDEELGDTEIII